MFHTACLSVSYPIDCRYWNCPARPWLHLLDSFRTADAYLQPGFGGFHTPVAAPSYQYANQYLAGVGLLYQTAEIAYGFFDTKLTGDLLQRMNDHNRVEKFLTTQMLSVFFLR